MLLKQPPAHLSRYVRYGWQSAIYADPSGSQSTIVMAEGCPGLIVYESERGSLRKVGKVLPTALLYGQATQSAVLHLPGTVRLTGVCFQPDALKSLFGIDAYELTNTCLDLRELPGHQRLFGLEQLTHHTGSGSPVDALFAYLETQVRRSNVPEDATVQAILNRIIDKNGAVSVRQLQQWTRLSERSLERRFKQSVGISPQLFARICRFQGSLHQLQQRTYTKLSDIAFDSGYADQSHFIRAFKEFAGVLPAQFVNASNSVLHGFPELIA